MRIGMGKENRRRVAYNALLVLMLPLLVLSSVSVVTAADETSSTAPLCRFGVNVDRRVDAITAYDTSSLRIGWYLDYHTAESPTTPNGAEYTQMIRLSQSGDDYGHSPNQSQIEDIVDANHGAIWFVANEPDRRQYQDEIDPDIYAVAYHDLYHLIKDRDPSARIFPGSIVQATELRLRYLDLMLAAYRETYGVILPADGWSIHGFILNEVNSENNPGNLPEWGAGVPPGLDDPYGLTIDVQDTDDTDLYEQQVERFRNWMAARGYRNVPLYMSEYGVLMPSGLGFDPDFTVGRVNAFMDQTFDYLLTTTNEDVGYPADNNRLVQRLSWYSVNDKGFNGYLFDVDDNNNLSLMGQNYAQYAAGMDIDLDLYPVKLSVTPGSPLIQDGAADLTLIAQIANSGNGQAATAATVRFYNGDPSAGGVQIGATQNVSVNGCGAIVTAKVDWGDVAPAAYQLYVDVQPVSETDIQPENNQMANDFSFAVGRLLLPMASLPQE